MQCDAMNMWYAAHGSTDGRIQRRLLKDRQQQVVGGPLPQVGGPLQGELLGESEGDPAVVQNAEH